MYVNYLVACVLAWPSLTAALLIPEFQASEIFFQLNEQNPHKESQPLIEKAGVESAGWLHKPNWLKHVVDSEKLQNLITVEELNRTANELYDVAHASVKEYGHPTRVIGSAGHHATIDWILSKFDKNKDYYDCHLQEFPAMTSRVESFNIAYINGTKIVNAAPIPLTPGVEAFLGKVVEVPNLGCNLEDYITALPKNGKAIALIEKGQCHVSVKSKLAGEAGFHAAIMYDNKLSDKVASDTLGEVNKDYIATFGVTKDVGTALKAEISTSENEFYLDLYVDVLVENIVTKNIICETKHGDGENIVVLGSHTDSVAAGPGMNDDGSGVVSLLTVAEHLTKFKVNNKVRFLFSSAEEEGMLGSYYYVSQLTPEENIKIRLFMDYDMMASPNYQYKIYNGNNIEHPNGSENLKNLYIDYYVSNGLNYSFIPFERGSDYAGFLEADPFPIPAGGIATGATGINPENGIAYDVCNHLLCDDLSNLDYEAFLINTKLIAHSVATYGKSFEGFPVREFTK